VRDPGLQTARDSAPPGEREPSFTKLKIALTTSLALAAVFGWANWPPPPLPADTVVSSVLVEKSARRLTLLREGAAIRTYRVSLGRDPVAAKQQEGDHRTPEGNYFLEWRNKKSSYHLSLHVSYPSPADIARAREAGVSPGGEIMVHGIRNGLGWLGRPQRASDWTLGCIALTNPEIEQIWHVVPDGTPIEIRP
jgi:murein L,D-transpeptidase YafK